MRNFLSAAPSLFSARSVTVNSPAVGKVPVRRPVWESSISPDGRGVAENLMGRSPVAGIMNKNGEPGRTPKTLAPLIRGAAGAAGVRI